MHNKNLRNRQKLVKYNLYLTKVKKMMKKLNKQAQNLKKLKLNKKVPCSEVWEDSEEVLQQLNQNKKTKIAKKCLILLCLAIWRLISKPVKLRQIWQLRIKNSKNLYLEMLMELLKLVTIRYKIQPARKNQHLCLELCYRLLRQTNLKQINLRHKTNLLKKDRCLEVLGQEHYSEQASLK